MNKRNSLQFNEMRINRGIKEKTKPKTKISYFHNFALLFFADEIMNVQFLLNYH